MVRGREKGTNQRGIKIMGSTGSTMEGEGEEEQKTSPSSDGGTWRDDGTISDMSMSEEKEQGQQE